MSSKINSIKFFLFCPIPNEQKPINEYLELKNSIQKTKYVTNSNLIKNIGILFRTIINEIIQIFLLIRWINIEKNFNKSIVVYEEASWYDGQIWEKPFFLIKNDRLINSQIINPILKKNLFQLFRFLLILNLTYYIYNN